MIKRIMSYKINASNAQEAMQLAKEMNDFVNKKHPRISHEVYIGKYGELFTIYTIAQFDNIGQMDETMSATRADEKFQALAAKNSEFYIEGSYKMTLLETF